MLSKKIRYKNLDGQWLEEMFWFNISPDEAIKLETEYREEGGSFASEFEKAAKTGNKLSIARLFRTLIQTSYGLRHEDGVRFLKEDDNGKPYFKQFSETDAYTRLLLELMDFDNFTAFMDAVVDPEYVEMIKATAAKNEARAAARTIDEIPEEELLRMDTDAFNKLAGPKGNRSKRTIHIMELRKRNGRARLLGEVLP